ncbi:hypothetical protein DINM_000702, partial [Dirofilaria immitis]|nr:hypothetical protein [Dirofilaria immitis]
MRLERFEYHVICLSSSDIEGNDGMLCNIQRHDLFSVRVGCLLLIRDIITKFSVTFSLGSAIRRQLMFDPTVTVKFRNTAQQFVGQFDVTETGIQSTKTAVGTREERQTPKKDTTY